MTFRSVRKLVPGIHVADYAVREPRQKGPARLILLLHGYTQSGASMMRKCEPLFSSTEFDDALIVAPCGPYPLPRRTESGYSVGYSWYFYDPFTDEYFIDMEIALRYLEALLESLGARALAATVIGFSQGGYLAPFLGRTLPNLEQVVGIAAQYLKGEVPEPVSFRMDAIHGSADEVVPIGPAEQAHAEFLHAGARGVFRRVEGAGHRIDAEMLSALGELITRPSR